MDTTPHTIKHGKVYNRYKQEIITCTLCNKAKTTMLGTKRCDGCWELENRIMADLPLAKTIISRLELGRG